MIRRRRTDFNFPGDNQDKQAARLFLYKHALAAPIQGHAVTLAGTEPESEINLMRDYLRWPAHRAWFVDNSLRPEVVAALRRAKKQWPLANVERINLWNLIPKLGAIGFANLDFMGAPLQDETLKCFHDVAEKLLPEAIVGFTWIRGREHIEGHPASRLLWKLGKGFLGNERRWAGLLRAVDEISNGTLNLIGRWEYQHNHSPMSVAVFRKD